MSPGLPLACFCALSSPSSLQLLRPSMQIQAAGRAVEQSLLCFLQLIFVGLRLRHGLNGSRVALLRPSSFRESKPAWLPRGREPMFFASKHSHIAVTAQLHTGTRLLFRLLRCLCVYVAFIACFWCQALAGMNRAVQMVLSGRYGVSNSVRRAAGEVADRD